MYLVIACRCRCLRKNYELWCIVPPPVRPAAPCFWYTRHTKDSGKSPAAGERYGFPAKNIVVANDFSREVSYGGVDRQKMMIEIRSLYSMIIFGTLSLGYLHQLLIFFIAISVVVPLVVVVVVAFVTIFLRRRRG